MRRCDEHRRGAVLVMAAVTVVVAAGNNQRASTRGGCGGRSDLVSWEGSECLERAGRVVAVPGDCRGSPRLMNPALNPKPYTECTQIYRKL